jgi:uncharacterized protein YaiI (UPF0178 family)
MFTLYIDADACPVKDEVYRVARRYSMPVKVVANSPLRVPGGAAVEMIVCSGFGAADDWIAERAGPGDVVVTADVPLAARCVAAGAAALDPKGRPSTDSEVGAALAMRDLREEVAAERLGDGRPGPDDGQGPVPVPGQA